MALRGCLRSEIAESSDAEIKGRRCSPQYSPLRSCSHYCSKSPARRYDQRSTRFSVRRLLPDRYMVINRARHLCRIERPTNNSTFHFHCVCAELRVTNQEQTH